MSATLDPYEAFFTWCDANGFEDVGTGPTSAMDGGRFRAAISAYAATAHQAQHTQRGELYGIGVEGVTP